METFRFYVDAIRNHLGCSYEQLKNRLNQERKEAGPEFQKLFPQTRTFEANYHKPDGVLSGTTKEKCAHFFATQIGEFKQEWLSLSREEFLSALPQTIKTPIEKTLFDVIYGEQASDAPLPEAQKQRLELYAGVYQIARRNLLEPGVICLETLEILPDYHYGIRCLLTSQLGNPHRGCAGTSDQIIYFNFARIGDAGSPIIRKLFMQVPADGKVTYADGVMLLTSGKEMELCSAHCAIRQLNEGNVSKDTLRKLKNRNTPNGAAVDIDGLPSHGQIDRDHDSYAMFDNFLRREMIRHKGPAESHKYWSANKW